MNKKIILLSIFAAFLMLSMPVMSSIQSEKVTTDTENFQTVKKTNRCPLCADNKPLFNEDKPSFKPTDDDPCSFFYAMMNLNYELYIATGDTVYGSWTILYCILFEFFCVEGFSIPNNCALPA